MAYKMKHSPINFKDGDKDKDKDKKKKKDKVVYKIPIDKKYKDRNKDQKKEAARKRMARNMKATGRGDMVADN